jgi:hypothetical protein
MAKKKLFKDTGIFKALKAVAPKALDVATDIAADVFPPMAIVDKVVDEALKGKLNTSDKALLQSERRLYEEDYAMYMADVQDARTLYRHKSSTADHIAKGIMKFNLLIIMIMVIVEIIVIAFVDGQIAAVITGVIGTITGALINERTTVVNFFYGSSLGSKDKDKV